MVGTGGKGFIRIHSIIPRAARAVRWPAKDISEETWLFVVLVERADSRR